MSKRKHDEASGTANSSPDQPPPIFTSTPIHDRGSIFTAIYSPSTTSPRSFQKHPPFEGAMHKILAWRKPSSQKSLAGSFGASTNSTPGGGGDGVVTKVVCETGSDEDGEKYAGKKLEKVLVEMDVTGTIVVARWYGGVLLGPVRFKWIEDAAKEAIGKWKASLGEVKRVKVEGPLDDEKEKERLVRVLKERDANVGVLRELLAEKNRELKKLEAGKEEEQKVEEGSNTRSGAVMKGPVAAALDYNSLQLQRLKQLEKARDASLTWILKEIDAVEEKIKVFKEAKD